MSDTLSKKLSATKTIEKKSRPAASKSATDEALLADADSSGAIEAVETIVHSECPDPELYDVPHPTKDKMRDKVRGLLAESLQKDGEDFAAAEEVKTVGNAIENAMFEHFGATNPDYRSKYRELSFNFKDAKNHTLRENVLKRRIMLQKLLTMSGKELANEELKKTREEVHEKMTRDAMPYNKQAASTNMFKCHRCKQRKCTYFQMQTRSADEPLTTFVHCVNCGNRWKF